jgi:hypothetical protein
MTIHAIPGTASTPGRDRRAADITVGLDTDRVTIDGLTVDDPALADLLRRHPTDEHADLVRRVLTVGARGLLTMGLGVDVAAVEQRVRATLDAATEEAEHRIGELLDRGADAFSEGFDPERRSSHVARTLAEFTAWRNEFLERLDPDRAGSHTTTLLARLGELLGPDGALERRLHTALDPDADGSGLARVQTAMERRFQELRDLIVEDRGRADGKALEAERGTAQGYDFEDVVEERLRLVARAIGGCVVDRVSTTAGSLGPKRTVGDFVVELGDGPRVVVEAKHQATLTVAGRGGILAELDEAMANRGADAAICVAGKDAFPGEVGRFAVFGNRILVVDDGEGTLLDVAVRWAVALVRARVTAREPEIDVTVVAERVQRIRTLAERFKTGQRALTDVGKSVDAVRQSLSEMRSDLLELVDDVARELRIGT